MQIINNQRINIIDSKQVFAVETVSRTSGYETFRHTLLISTSMWIQTIKEANSILLVGESNFSFTVSLLNYVSSPTIITSTCFETDPDKEPRKKNVEKLRAKGVQILLGVDATKLSENQELRSGYDYIIFNFPHIGGKSRIHRNRELLRSFFSSASTHLTGTHDRSRVIVSLCQGQGGVLRDQPRRPRTHGDTWKVVEMAAHGGLILEKIEPFQANQFPDYNPSGYGKQGDGGFHTDGSLTYIFRKSRPPRPGLPLTSGCFHSESIHDLLSPREIQTSFGTISCSGFHARVYHDSPLKSEPIIHLLEYFIKKISPECVINADEEAPLHIDWPFPQKSKHHINGSTFTSGKKTKKLPAECSIGGRSASLRDSLVYSIPHLLHSRRLVLVTGHVFHDFSLDFSIPPVGTEAMLWGDGATTAVLDILMKLVGRGKCLLRMSSKDTSAGQSFFTRHFDSVCYEIVSLDQMLVLGHVFSEIFDTEEVCTVDLDALALIAYNANDWRELRSKGCHVSHHSKKSDSLLTFSNEEEINSENKREECDICPSCTEFKLIPESLYPPTFIFDVSFSLNNNFYDREFWALLWHVAGDIVTKVELLDTYNPPPDKVALGHKQSWCYRLNYCSYEWPMHRQSAVKVQNEVVNWAIVNVLGLCIK